MRRSLAQWFVTLSLALALLAVAEPAFAQLSTSGISLNTSIIGRKQPRRSNGQKPLWINRDDCVNDDVLTFTAGLTNYSGYNLEVWAGPAGSVDCTDVANRSGTSPQCWLVYRNSPQSTPFTIEIRAQDIVAQHLPTSATVTTSTGGTTGTGGAGGTGGTTSTGGLTSTGGTTSVSTCTVGANGLPLSASTIPLPGCPSDCDRPADSDQGLQIALYFFFIDSNTIRGQAPPYTASGFDVSRPPPPTDVTAHSGETRLKVEWDLVTVPDLLEYHIYCDPRPGAVPDAGVSTTSFDPGLSLFAAGVDASTGVGGALGTGGTTGTGAVTAIGGTDGGLPDASVATGGAITVTTGGTTSTGTSTSKCPSTPAALVAGAEPNEYYRCGTVTGKLGDHGEANGLVNNIPYRVAVAAVDQVGNRGVLSDVSCEIPVEVTDFYELYKQLGGKGGGGFCEISRRTVPSPVWTLGTLALVGLALLRRRGRSA